MRSQSDAAGEYIWSRMASTCYAELCQQATTTCDAKRMSDGTDVSLKIEKLSVHPYDTIGYWQFLAFEELAFWSTQPLRADL